MEDKITGMDPLVLIHLRNVFYRRKYHLVLSACLLGLVMIMALVGILSYLIKYPPYPLYFVADSAGRLIQDIPLQSPNMTTEQVAAWAKEAIESAYSYDYVNYHVQLQSAQKYFTDYGWKNYMDALDASNNLEALKLRRQIVLAKVVGSPKLLNEGPLGKSATYAWKFQMPIIVTYLVSPYDNIPGKSRTQNALITTILIARQSMLTSQDGLGIVQLISEMAS